MVDMFNKYDFDIQLIYRKNLAVFSLINLEEIKTLYNCEIYEINLGVELSEKLMNIDNNMRKHCLLKTLNQIILTVDAPLLIIMNIDILFNPDYKLNIIKYFMNIARNKMILVQWPGVLKGYVLQYSEVKYSDYVNYDLRDYEIAFIK